jgi:ABC-type sugar transport system ATPase subunit
MEVLEGKKSDIILEFKDITKTFPGVVALKNISFTIKKGTVHALVGENGAGKSTLMKILNGLYHADSGEIHLDGEKVQIKDSLQAQQHGIAMVRN